jgi:hypothetical protein
MNENIYLTFQENEEENDVFVEDLSGLLLPPEDITINSSQYMNYYYYSMNYNVKQLLIICDYYGLKNLKKKNKLNIIDSIVNFEDKNENIDIVNKRKHFWYYIEELKRDKFMKKYILL